MLNTIIHIKRFGVSFVAVFAVILHAAIAFGFLM